MDALREIVDVRQVPGEPKRRWFSSDDIDLIVWLDDSGAPVSFQLCYDVISRFTGVSGQLPSEIVEFVTERL